MCEVLNFEPGNILTHKKCLTWLTDSIFTVASEINEWLSESIPVHIIHACIKQGDTVPIIQMYTFLWYLDCNYPSEIFFLTKSESKPTAEKTSIFFPD